MAFGLKKKDHGAAVHGCRTPFILHLIVFSLFLSLSGCTQHLTPTNVVNSPPVTYVTAFPYRDSIQTTNFNAQASLLEIKWWANDPHGLVIGYIISLTDHAIPVNNKIWTFTTKDDMYLLSSVVSKGHCLHF